MEHGVPETIGFWNGVKAVFFCVPKTEVYGTRVNFAVSKPSVIGTRFSQPFQKQSSYWNTSAPAGLCDSN